jgi:2-polyprenyl-3-methyl-5-hydroxy-6-metoxy-1,4-benzoquinol methylase
MKAIPETPRAAIPASLLTWEQAVSHARETPEMAGLVELCYYDDPIERAAQRFRASEEWAGIMDLLAPEGGAKVLEIGAGRGIMSWAFASEGCDVTAVEPDPSALIGAGAIRQLCTLTGKNVKIVDAVGERLSVPADGFDIVVCRAVLHHVSDLPQVCREVFRVLKPGGRFLAIKEHAADSAEELAAFLRAHPLHHLYGGEHAFPLACYLNALREAGFDRVKNYGPFDHPVSSAPAVTTSVIREMLTRAVASRTSLRMGSFVASSDLAVTAYRRWLTHKCEAAGRLHSFLAVKPK